MLMPSTEAHSGMRGSLGLRTQPRSEKSPGATVHTQRQQGFSGSPAPSKLASAQASGRRRVGSVTNTDWHQLYTAGTSPKGLSEA